MKNSSNYTLSTVKRPYLNILISILIIAALSTTIVSAGNDKDYHSPPQAGSSTVPSSWSSTWAMSDTSEIGVNN